MRVSAAAPASMLLLLACVCLLASCWSLLVSAAPFGSVVHARVWSNGFCQLVPSNAADLATDVCIPSDNNDGSHIFRCDQRWVNITSYTDLTCQTGANLASIDNDLCILIADSLSFQYTCGFGASSSSSSSSSSTGVASSFSSSSSSSGSVPQYWSSSTAGVYDNRTKCQKAPLECAAPQTHAPAAVIVTMMLVAAAALASVL